MERSPFSLTRSLLWETEELEEGKGLEVLGKEEEDNVPPELVERNDTAEFAEMVTKTRGGKEVLLRPSLPRESKSSHKVISNIYSQSSRDLPKIQNRKPPPKRC